jgi:general secretion pathway protein G
MEATLERLRERRDEMGDEGGFTLIELLIVIVILGVLAAIVVFAVQNVTGSSARATCASDVSTVDHAVQAFQAQVGKAPTSITDLQKPWTGTNQDKVGPWLHNTPTNGTHYKVTLTGTGGIDVTAPVGGTTLHYTTASDTPPGAGVTPQSVCANAS